jgi:hypothetical protein
VYFLHNEFWTQSDELRELGTERGCYVFAIRAGKGVTPIYVGKATKSFKQECFNPSNRHKFSNGMADYVKGTPVLYFVRHPKQKGKTEFEANWRNREFSDPKRRRQEFKSTESAWYGSPQMVY